MRQDLSTPFQTVTYERQMSEASDNRDQIINSLSETVSILREDIAALQIMIDNQGWMSVNQMEGKDDFPRDFLTRSIDFAKNMYIFNPMVKRAVEVKQLYIWALGFSIHSDNPVLQQFAKDFLSSPRNEVEFNLDGLSEKEAVLNYSGNLFLAFFTNRTTGEVRVRSISTSDIGEIYTNPMDKKEPWYYKRAIPSTNPAEAQFEWHPDFRYYPLKRPDSLETNGKRYPIRWDVPIFHIKTGGVDGMRWGFPEIFSSLPWASTYKKFLENWSVIMESYAKVSMQMARTEKAKDPGSRTKLQAQTMQQQIIGERNGTADVGKWLLGGVELKAVKTAGQTTSAEEGRPLSLMVAAGTGLPITFFGDVDVGNFATASTLDRPTELLMVRRQGSWRAWMGKVFEYAMIRSALAPRGVLRQAGFRVLETINPIDECREYRLLPPEGSTSEVMMKFPDIIERNATERIRSLVMGVTLMGKKISNVVPDLRYVTRKMLEAFGEPPQFIEELMSRWESEGMFGDKMPEDVNPEEPQPVGGFGGGNG
jgi:hypothetical protein